MTHFKISHQFLSFPLESGQWK